MRKIFIIGTVHKGLTKLEELKKALEKISPDQLLIEIEDKDLRMEIFDKYSNEMVFAYKWAKSNKIDVRGFDFSFDVSKEGANNEEAIKESKRAIKNISWKELNREKNIKILDKIYFKYVDLDKDRIREERMLNNINKLILKNGIIVILTGIGHLRFFEENLKEAIFPFRN